MGAPADGRQATCLLARARRRAGVCVKWITKKTGYTADQLAAGVQVATGLFLMLACFGWPKAWDALTLNDSAITPVYAIVTFIVVLQPNLGTASQFVLMRAAGAVVGGLVGLLCMYITQAANGGSYANTTTKGAVMVTLMSIFTFIFSLLRFRFTRWWFSFTVATFSMPMVALNPYYLDFVQYRALFFWWLQIALGIGMAALMATFVFPITAGAKVQARTAESMRKLAGLTSATVACMVGLQLGEEGLPVGVTGMLDGQNAGDTGLSDSFKPLYDTATSIATVLTQIRALLTVVDTEWNAYSSAHTFPREAYAILVYILRAYLSSLMALLYPLQSGRLALRAVQKMGPEFQKAADLLAACLNSAADCIAEGANYEAALGKLRVLEERWRLLGALCPVLNSSWGENEVLTSDMLVGTLFSLGTRVRRLYFTLPEALKASQMGARHASFKHFHGHQREVWDLAQPQELRERARLRAVTPRVNDMASPRAGPLSSRKPQQQQQQEEDDQQRQEGQKQEEGQQEEGQQQQQQQQQQLSATNTPTAGHPGGSPFRQWVSPRRAPLLGALPLPQKLTSPRHEAGRAAVHAWRYLSPSKLDRVGDGAAVPAAAAAAPAAGPQQAQQQQQQQQQQVPAPHPPLPHITSNGSQAGVAGDADDADNGGPGQQLPAWPALPSRQCTQDAVAPHAHWQPPDAATLALRFPPTLYLPPAARLGPVAATLRKLRQRTGFTAEHAALALQMALAMAAACTLHVTPASYEALHEKTIWLVVTVAVVLESAVGGLVLKSGLRIIGTCAAGLLGVGLIGIVYLCNGSNYQNDPPKFLVMSILLPLLLFLLMLNHVRFAVPYGYMLSCCKFTTPIIALSGYILEVAFWQTALFRIINILLGIGLDLATATFILPVTSRQATRHRVQEVLGGLADVAEAVILDFVSEAPGGEQAPHHSQHAQHPQHAHHTHQTAASAAAAASGTPDGSGRGSLLATLSTFSGGGGTTPGGTGGGGRTPSHPHSSFSPRFRTPLSASEALEVMVNGLGQRQQARRERKEVEIELEFELVLTGHQGGTSAATPTASRADSLEAGSLLGSADEGGDSQGQGHRRFFRWRHSRHSGSGSKGSTPRGAADGAGGAPADVEQGALVPAATVAAHREGGEGNTPSAAAAAASSSAAASSASPSNKWGLGASCLPPDASWQRRFSSPRSRPVDVSVDIPGSPFCQDAASTSPSDPLNAAPLRPSPLQLPSPAAPVHARQPRRGASLPPDLPTVISQQVLQYEELPNLPPLHIPLHHQLTIAEDPDLAFNTSSSPSPLPTAHPTLPRLTPLAFGLPPGRSAEAAETSPQGSPEEGGGGRGQAVMRRPSTSSTAFWMGTPKKGPARRNRSRWLHERALGKSFMAVRQQGADLAGVIAHMHELALFARFEWSPFERPHRMPPQDILAAQHACRKLLNVLLTFAYLADSPDVPHRRLLMPMPGEVRAVASQMGESLRALSEVLDRRLPLDRALQMVFNLQMQVQLLLLEVEEAGQGMNVEEGRADAVLGVAALGVMFSATQTVQLLYRCVLRLLGTPAEHAAAEQAFAQSAAWGASVEAILVARGVVLSSLLTDTQEAGPAAAAHAEGQAEMEAAGMMGRGD